MRRLRPMLSLAMLLLLAGCGGRQSGGDAGPLVSHHLAIDPDGRPGPAVALWQSILDRIQPGSSLSAALPAWPDTAILHPALRRLSATPEAHLHLVIDSAHAASHPSRRDSLQPWIDAGSLRIDLSPSGTHDALFVARQLRPDSTHDGENLLGLILAPQGQGRLILAISGDEGLTEAVLERIQQAASGQPSKVLVRTLTRTDQLEHQLHYYPLPWAACPLDSLLDQLAAGLIEQPRPARLRMLTPHLPDSALLARVADLQDAHELEFHAVIGRQDSSSLPTPGLEVLAAQGRLRTAPWVPDLILLEGPMLIDTASPPQRRQWVLAGSVPLTRPQLAPQGGILFALAGASAHAAAQAQWQKIWETARPIAHPVELWEQK